MKARPGNRKQRWQQAYAGEAILYFAGAVAFGLLASGPAVGFIIAFLVFGGLLCLIDYKRGWKMRYDLPEHGRRAIERGCPIAKAAWEDTQRAARNPKRKRYAFDKEPTP